MKVEQRLIMTKWRAWHAATCGMETDLRFSVVHWQFVPSTTNTLPIDGADE